jgi:hypothetical protein
VLSDHERRRLARIQAELAADDPEFVAGFEADLLGFARGGDADRVAHRLCTVVMWVAVVLGLLQLTAGVVDGAILMALVAVGFYLARRYNLLPPQHL